MNAGAGFPLAPDLMAHEMTEGKSNGGSTPSPLLVLFGWGVGRRVEHPEGELFFAQARAWSLHHGVVAAADWMAAQGIPRELAVFALVGARRAPQYGVRPGLTWNRWGRADA
jgi:hypothetical protein